MVLLDQSGATVGVAGVPEGSTAVKVGETGVSAGVEVYSGNLVGTGVFTGVCSAGVIEGGGIGATVAV